MELCLGLYYSNKSSLMKTFLTVLYDYKTYLFVLPDAGST